MWKAKLINGDEFNLNDVEAKALIAGMEARLPVNLGYAVINGISVASLVDVEASKFKTNPIISDNDAQEYLLHGDYKKIDLLNSRYPGDKFEKEWKQALEYKKKIENGEIKLLG
ncbi:MAG: hypothetical protein WC243_04660 [Patescibacteria group bacterium]|jgi:hypothetical protein